MNSISNILRSMIFVFSAGASFCAMSQQAAATPFIVGNNYTELQGKSCPAIITNLCDLSSLTAVAAGKTLTLNRVSCRVDITTASVSISHLSAGRMVGTAGTSVQYLAPISALGSGKYQVNADVNIVIPAGAKPFVRLVTAGTTGAALSCSVAGTITP